MLMREGSTGCANLTVGVEEALSRQATGKERGLHRGKGGAPGGGSV